MRRKMAAGMMLTLCVMSTLTVAFDLKLGLADLSAQNVYSGWSYGSIQEAIDAASPGDVIHVPPGTYYENVVVTKAVWLIGNDSTTTTIDGGGSGHVVEIMANHTRIEGFTIQNAGTYDSGISIFRSHYNSLIGNRIVSNSRGVGLYGSNYNIIVNSNITSNEEGGISITDSNNTLVSQNNITSNPIFGIRMWNASYTLIANNTLINSNVLRGIHVREYSHHNVILGNNITLGNYGIDLSPNPNGFDEPPPFNNTIISNTITSCSVEVGEAYGIRMIKAFNNTISENVVMHNDNSIVLYSAPSNIIEKNVMTSNGFWGGITVSWSDFVSIRENEISNDNGGISLNDSNNCTVVDNDVLASRWGLSVWSNSCVIGQNKIKDNPEGGISVRGFNNEIYNNIFIGNSPNAEVLAGGGPNSWNKSTQGNFWSDYSGVGNYSIHEPDNVDHHPLILVPFSITTEPLRPKMNEPYKLKVRLTNIEAEKDFTLSVRYDDADPWEHPWLPLAGWPLEHRVNGSPIPFNTSTQTYTIGSNETQEFTFDITNEWQWIEPANWVDYVIGYLLGFIDPIHVTDVISFIQWCATALTAVPKVKYSVVKGPDSTENITFSTEMTVEVSKEKKEYLFSSALSQMSASLWTAVATASPDPYTKILAAALAASFTVASYSFYVAAEDPNPDYGEVVHPISIPVPDEVKSLPEGITKQLALAALNLTSLENATATSYTRYQGAKDDGNQTCMELQLAATMKYNDMATRKMQEVQFLSAIATADMNPLNDDQMDQFWTETDKNGLPSLQQEILGSAGFSTEMISDLTQGILNSTETPEQRALYKDPADYIKYTHHTIEAHYTEAYEFQTTAEEENLSVQPEHDVTITDVWSSAPEVYAGDNVTINVEVENYGNYAENPNVTVYVSNATVTITLGPKPASGLAPGAKRTLTFVWDTSGVSPDYYRMKAVADPVTGENFTADNTYIDGTLNVRYVYDRRVSSVIPFPRVSTRGDPVSIYVTVENQGNFTETFNVIAYANTTAIETKEITLTSGSSKTISFTWNTIGFASGNYIISAYATPAPKETRKDDNTYIDGTVTIALDVTNGTTPIVDGRISPGEYDDANSLTFTTSGGTCTVYLKHNDTSVHVAFDVPNKYYYSAVKIFVDTDYNRSPHPETDDYVFTIRFDGEIGENQGTGTGWAPWAPAVGWTGARQVLASRWNAEFTIRYPKLGITRSSAKTIGISFLNYIQELSGYGWPTDADWENPSTWGIASSSDNWASVYWWPMFRHDPSHTGYSTSIAPETNGTSWSYTTGDRVFSSPAIIDKRVFVGSYDHKVYALDAATGAFIWSYATGDWVSSSPAVVDGKVYVGSWDRKVYCLDAESGEHIWNYTTNDIVHSSPAVIDGKVYVGSYYLGGAKLYCLNAATGAHIWSYPLELDVYASPAVVDGRVYIGSNFEHNVYCLNASTGAFIWSYTIGPGVHSSPAVVDGNVYWGSDDGKVYCLNASTGAFIWNYTTGGEVNSSPAVAYGKVYVGSFDNKVYCLDAESGEHIWNYTTGSDVLSSPGVADGKVYVGSYAGRLYCLDAATGDFIWSYTTGDWVSSSPAVADGRVYVGSGDNKVYAFGPLVPYDVTIEAYCYTEVQDVSVGITQDGTPTGYNTPHTFPSLTGTHIFTVPGADTNGHAFKEWSTGETSTTITVTSAGTYTAYYEILPPQALELYPTEVVDLIDPTGTQWHELRPVKGNFYHLASWEPGMVLSPYDQIVMEPVEPAGPLEEFEVDEVTVDLVVLDEGTGIEHWLDYKCGYWTFDPEKPVGTMWNEIKPDPGRCWNLVSWEDDGDGKLGFCDYIDMTPMFPFPGPVAWFHVEQVTVTVELTSELDFTQRCLEFMGILDEFQLEDYIHGPIGTMWHEIWPEQGRIWHLWDWFDGFVFSPSDNIVLSLKDEFGEPIPGSEAEYHVDKLTVAMNLTSMLDGKEHIVRFEGVLKQFMEYDWEDPVSTQWHEVNPDYCRQWHLWDWLDTDVIGILDPCDQILMMDKETGELEEFHVEALSTDIIVTPKGPEHDVAIMNVTLSKTVVGQGYCMNINLTVENQGDFPETFNVTAYYCNETLTREQWETFWSMGDVNRDGYINDVDGDLITAAWGSFPGHPDWNPDADLNQDLVIDMFDLTIFSFNYGLDIWSYFVSGGPIQMQTVVNLPTWSSTTLTFTWDTTGIPYGNYTIGAYATPIPSEINTADNNLGNGVVTVTIAGDCDGDLDVDYDDFIVLAGAYGSSSGNPAYRREADFDDDGDVDYDDFILLAGNYGKTL